MNHREAIGGKWDQIGDLQFNFIKSRGLTPESKILDIGCGALRGGVRFIKFLNDKNYFALEKEKDILFSGIKEELNDDPENPKLFTYNMTGDFEIPEDWPLFDFMLAQSVFTHLLPEQIDDCLSKVKAKLGSGSFYATYFDSKEIDKSSPHGWRKNERSVAKYPFSLFEELAENNSMEVENIGSWDHPRDQRMLLFTNKDKG